MDIGGQVGGRQVGSWQIQRNRKTETGRQVGSRHIVSGHRWAGQRKTGRQLADVCKGIGRQVDGRQVSGSQ